ncbi:hypothetical protein J6590_093739 [Homalodisca vitripennis]|nr:hypothetical protein J6590_093739 [Homalodisca vitripennis]
MASLQHHYQAQEFGFRRHLIHNVEANFTRDKIHLPKTSYLICSSVGKGYHVITDNFYTKLSLALRLLDNSIYLTGTINKNSKDLLLCVEYCSWCRSLCTSGEVWFFL